MKLSFIIIICLSITGCRFQSKTVIYPAPKEERRSLQFDVYVNKQSLFVYEARVSKFPINQIWPGYQRPIEQTELASFTYFDFKGEVEVTILSKQEIRSFKIHPAGYAIKPEIEGNSIKFRLRNFGQITIEINDYHNSLHLFANPLEEFTDRESSNVKYFGPGIHEAGIINLNSNETIFIEGGAIVYGVINCENASNVKILGRGILDAGKFQRGQVPNMIRLKNVVNAQIEGIILRDPHILTVVPINCDSVYIDNLKLIGLWRYNTDGIDIINSKNIKISNCFIRSFDDCIAIKGFKETFNSRFSVIKNISVNKCTLWNDWGRALEIGAETVADSIKDISFTDCYIPHFTAVALDIQNCDRAHISNVLFQNILIEDPILDSARVGKSPIISTAWGKLLVLGIYGSFYSSDSLHGTISNIYLKNVRMNKTPDQYTRNFSSDNSLIDKSVTLKHYDIFIRDNIYFGDIEKNCSSYSPIYIHGFSNNHFVSNISIMNCSINKTIIKDLKMIGYNNFVQNIYFK